MELSRQPRGREGVKDWDDVATACSGSPGLSTTGPSSARRFTLTAATSPLRHVARYFQMNGKDYVPYLGMLAYNGLQP